jgi:hypothetical protein
MKKSAEAIDWATRPLDDELGEALRAELLGWPGVTLRPMMGTLAVFRRKQMLGCYVNRALARKKPRWLNHPSEPTLVWVRLRLEDAERALRRPGVSRCRLGFVGWIELSLESRENLTEAVRWFGHSYEHPPRLAARQPLKNRRQVST